MVSRYKARLVAVGSKQVSTQFSDLDYSAPVIGSLSIKLLLAIAVNDNYQINHLDIKNAYLHADIFEAVYMNQPPGYVIGKNLVCKLLKSIYGLKCSAINWYNKLRITLLNLNFEMCLTENCIFYNKDMIIGVYVDDLIVLYKSSKIFQEFFSKLSSELKVIDQGPISKCLSLNIKYDLKSNSLTIGQPNYIDDMLMEFKMANCKPTSTPIVPGFYISSDDPLYEYITYYQQLVGSLLYLANASRPDICFAVNLLCRSMHQPLVKHFELAKRVISYLSGTKNFKLIYKKSNVSKIDLYADADFGNINNDNKSLTGLMVKFNECLISWSSKRQKYISQSTCEAEVNCILDATNETEFLNDLLGELDIKINLPMSLYNDNQSPEKSITNGGNFNSNRHYRLRLGRIREAVRIELIKVIYCPTEIMIADLLTKAFTERKLKDLIILIGLVN